MRASLFVLLLLVSGVLNAQKGLVNGNWKGYLVREDKKEVVFTFDITGKFPKQQLIIKNGTERIKISKLIFKGDSIYFDMPVFESSFRVKATEGSKLEGWWIKGTSAAPQKWAFRAEQTNAPRFEGSATPTANISGRWAMFITRPNKTERPAVAEFKQVGDYLTGSVITPSGDYRFLEGKVIGDSMVLSVFDGSHVYHFNAKIADSGAIRKGVFYSGYNTTETWIAYKDPKAELPDVGNTPMVRQPERPLDFKFPDLDSNLVSITDDRYKGKVVVIQLMGSWCPNCMDETAFLSDFYNKQGRDKKVEIIALAYEYSTDFKRSVASLTKFKNRYNVKYPMLITPTTVIDTLRTEKTLPQITTIRVYPTTIIVGKDGRIRKIDTGFVGPGTGVHYDAYVKNFVELLARLNEEEN